MPDSLSGGQVTIPVKGDASGFSEGAKKDIEAQSGKFSDIGKNLGGFITKGLGLAGIALGIGALVKGGFDEATEMQSVNAQLEAGIKSTGNAAGLSVAKMDALAKSVSAYSGQTMPAIANTEKVLQTFANISAVGPDKIFDRATKAAADMAAKLGGDAASNARLLGKALNDPENALGALIRRGVQFTDAQKDQIKAMQDAGNLAGAQGVILDQLSSKFGGAAKAAGSTFPGEMNKLKNAFKELFADAIEKILPTLNPVINSVIKVLHSLSPVMEILGKAFSSILNATLKPLLPVITQVANMLGPILEPIIKTLTPIISLVASTLGMVLKAAMPLIDALLELLQPLLALIGPILKPLLQLLTPLIQMLAEGLTGAVKFLTPIIIGLADGIGKVLVPVIQTITKVLGDVINFIVDVFSGNWQKAWNDIVKVFTDIFDGIGGVVAGVVNGVIDIINGIIKGVDGLNIPGIKIGLVPHWNGQIPGLANGGTVLSAGWTMVGENGPEAAYLGAGSIVSPNIGTAAASSIPDTITLVDKDGSILGRMKTIVGDAAHARKTALSAGVQKAYT